MTSARSGRRPARRAVRSAPDGPDQRGATPARGPRRRAVAVLGSVPQRAPVGHGARGLQRQRRRVVVLLPRPGALARLPLGRGRPGRAVRRAPAAVLRARRCGTSTTRSSRSASSGSPTARATTARTSRSTTSSSTTCPRTASSAGSTSTRRPPTRTTTSWRRTAPGPATRPSTSCSTRAIFDDDRYFDVEVTYAKADTGDLVCRIAVHNRGPEDAPIHLLPTLWFRNTWTFPPHTPRPTLTAGRAGRRARRAPRDRDVAPPRARRGDAAVLRQRVQRGAPVGRGRLAAVPEGRHRRPRPARHAPP